MSWPPSPLLGVSAGVAFTVAKPLTWRFILTAAQQTVYQLLTQGERVTEDGWMASLESCRKSGDRRKLEENRMLRNPQGVERHHVVWAGIEKMAFSAWEEKCSSLGTRSLRMCTCPNISSLPVKSVLHTSFIQLRKTISCNKNNNNINRNSQYIVSTYYVPGLLQVHCMYERINFLQQPCKLGLPLLSHYRNAEMKAQRGCKTCPGGSSGEPVYVGIKSINFDFRPWNARCLTLDKLINIMTFSFHL